jgi:hypothetical protein
MDITGKNVIDEIISPYLDIEYYIKKNDLKSFSKCKNYPCTIWKSLIRLKRLKMIRYLFDKEYSYDRKVIEKEICENPEIQMMHFFVKRDPQIISSRGIEKLIERNDAKFLHFLFKYKNKSNGIFPYKQFIADRCFQNSKIDMLNYLNDLDDDWMFSKRYLKLEFRYCVDKSLVDWIYKNMEINRIKNVLKLLVKYKRTDILLYVLHEYKKKISCEEMDDCFRKLLKKKKEYIKKHYNETKDFNDISTLLNYIVFFFMKDILDITNRKSKNYKAGFIDNCWYEAIMENPLIINEHKNQFKMQILSLPQIP